MQEEPKTSIQTLNVDEFDHKLTQPRASFPEYRKMREDPTIALARQLAIAPILSSSWGLESDDGVDEQRAFIKWQTDKIRRDFMRVTLLSQVDFGWKAFEKTFKIVTHATHGTRFVIDRIKPLRNDNTYALYGVKTGRFLGLAQDDLRTGAQIYIDADHSLFVNQDDEGVNDYGRPLIASVEAPYGEWNDTNDAANRYDTKIAGSHWVVYYPVGRSRFNGVDDVDNSKIASNVLATLKSSGSVKIPVKVQSFMDSSERDTGWKIDLVSDAGKSADFVTRLKYLDSLKVRGMMIPERSVIEGTFGTKAEADSHFNAALMIMQLRHEAITEYVNKRLVDQLLMVNYGEKGTVRLIANPLIDERKAMFRELFSSLISNPSTSVDILDSLQIEEVMDSLKIPHTELVED